MPLQQLARQISLTHKRATLTPVLVTPSYLTLQTPFFVALASELAACNQRQVRFDWYRGMPGAFSFGGDWLARRKTARINRAFVSVLQPVGLTTSMRITAAIGRPSGSQLSSTSPSEELVIGISADRHELPTWTTPIRLAATATDNESLEPVEAMLVHS